MELAAAKVLAKHDGDLDLSGLKSLSLEVAKALSKFGSNNDDNNLNLNGLTELPAEVAKSLSGCQCDTLYLNGLTSLSEELASALAEFEYISAIELDGISYISDPVAKILSGFSASISLFGLTELSEIAAEYLGNHENSIFFSSTLESNL